MPGEETPRVTVRKIEPFKLIASASRMELVVDTTDSVAVEALAALMAQSRGGRSELFLRTSAGNGQAVRLFLGDDFLLGADQVDAMSVIPNLTIHRFERMEPTQDGYRTRNRRAGMRLVG